MDVELFIKRRKQLGYSQVALSKGICTQSTLSKFEKDSQVPSLAILTRLCNRLGLTIDDLTRKDASSARYIRDTLDQVEEGLMIENFPQVSAGLNKLKIDQIMANKEKMRYFYLEGFNYVLTNQVARSCSPSPRFSMNWTNATKRFIRTWPTSGWGFTTPVTTQWNGPVSSSLRSPTT